MLSEIKSATLNRPDVLEQVAIIKNATDYGDYVMASYALEHLGVIEDRNGRYAARDAILNLREALRKEFGKPLETAYRAASIPAPVKARGAKAA